MGACAFRQDERRANDVGPARRAITDGAATLERELVAVVVSNGKQDRNARAILR